MTLEEIRQIIGPIGGKAEKDGRSWIAVLHEFSIREVLGLQDVITGRFEVRVWEGYEIAHYKPIAIEMVRQAGGPIFTSLIDALGAIGKAHDWIEADSHHHDYLSREKNRHHWR